MIANHYLSKLSVEQDDDKWCLVSHAENTVSEYVDSLGAIAVRLGKSPVVVLIDAAEVRTLRVKVPGRTESQVKQAAPYVVEEELAADIDELDIHVSKADVNGERIITVYELDAVRVFCQQLAQVGITISEVIPDASLIATKPNQLIAHCTNDRVLYGYDKGLFAATDSEIFPIVLNRLIRDENLSEVLIVTDADHSLSPDADALLEERIVKEHPDLKINIQSTQKSAFYNMASRLAVEGENNFIPNLYPQELAYKAPFGASRRASFLVAAGLAVIALLTHIFFIWSGNQSARAELVSLQSQQRAVFSEAFPEIKRVVNAEAQAKQRLAELKKQGPPPAEFLAVLRSTTAFLERNTPQDLRLTGFSFADGVLLLRTESKDMAVLENYRSELSGFISAEVVNAETGEDVVRGAIRVKSNQ